MPVMLSQNEIRARAAKFAQAWKDARREEAEAQSFLNDFFHVLGIERRKVALFEHRVQCLDEGNGYMDLFWKGQIIIEMKSRGQDRQKAYQQARRYAESLPLHEVPHAILICDFEHWDFYELDKGGEKASFTLEQLPEHLHLFLYLAGYGQREYVEEDPVNVKAAELMGRLHDALKATGYEGHPLEAYLVRLLFCLFADDTGIFNKDDFLFFLRENTAGDGRDLAARLAELFQVLNTPLEKRLSSRDEQLAAFPYINGGLFAEYLPMPAFDADMRRLLLECCALDWGNISPAIFGSMFQSVMKPEERRSLGAHYTSERNILKLINPLFMDGLREEFKGIRAEKNTRRRVKRLQGFHEKLAGLHFLDPACGCGNFLVVSYRELRLLELDVLKALHTDGQRVLNAADLCKVHVSQFYGIEIEEFPAQIAQVALWLIDHQMNRMVGEYYGQYFARIPLKDSATIVCGNALRLDWESVVPKEKLSYILGNPPFVGKSYQDKGQKEDMALVFNGVKAYGNLDFVASWFKKATDYVINSSIECAFVATNSLCQGIAVPPLWGYMLKQGMHINFAYRSFIWTNEAKKNASVHCIIVSFAAIPRKTKWIYAGKERREARNINPYLVDYDNIIVESRTKPFSNAPEMSVGSFAVDGGNLIMEEQEYLSWIQESPDVQALIRPYLSPDDFINKKKRYCLWLKGANLSQLRRIPRIMEKIRAVKEFRILSKKEQTQKKAATPWLFGEERQPEHDYILIPRTSSEKRQYIPIGFVSPETIAGDTIIMPDAGLFHFSVLTSSMHMAWMRLLSGRLGMGYRYAPQLVYNTFPWPMITEEQKSAIGELGQTVLDARDMYPQSSLADLYDPLLMPLELAQAHRRLDAAVEKLYREEPFLDDAERVAHLFGLYKKQVERESGGGEKKRR